MTLTRRKLIAGTSAAIGMAAIVTGASAQDAVTLRLHSFLPPVSNPHAKLLAPWAKKVEAESQGKLKIQIFPSMQLGGTPPQLFDQARDGVVDIIWTLPGSTPGRFPTSEVLELPFLMSGRGVVNAKVAQELANGHMQAELKDVKLLSFWAHDAGHIHASRPVKTLADLKGLKIRSPGRLAGEGLKALGATAIGMPITQVPESLAQKVIDGAAVPWEIVPAVRVHELVKNHTEITGSPALYAATFMLVMNKAKYEGLAPPLKAAIDKTTGMPFAEMAGAMWDAEAVRVREMVAKRNNAIIQLPADEKARWVKSTEPVYAAVDREREGQGRRRQADRDRAGSTRQA